MSRYSGQIREVINRNSLVSLALARGYNAFLPVYDGGIDFILYNEESGDTKLVQLKGRWTIDKKYVGRNVWIAFHDDGRWYLAPHDEMVKHAEGYGYASTKSWLEGGAYPLEDVTVTFHAHDRDKSRHWAARISEVSPDRKPLDLAPDIRPEELFTKDSVRADVLVTSVLDADGDYVPSVYYLSKVRGDEPRSGDQVA